MQLVKFLQESASQAMRLSRETLDLKTSRELRMLSEQLKEKSEERQKAIVSGAARSLETISG